MHADRGKQERTASGDETLAQRSPQSQTQSQSLRAINRGTSPAVERACYTRGEGTLLKDSRRRCARRARRARTRRRAWRGSRASRCRGGTACSRRAPATHARGARQGRSESVCGGRVQGACGACARRVQGCKGVPPSWRHSSGSLQWQRAAARPLSPGRATRAAWRWQVPPEERWHGEAR